MGNNIPKYDGDVLSLQFWVNQDAVAGPLEQANIRDSVRRVLGKMAALKEENDYLKGWLSEEE